jgi:hypothetical protein
VLFGLFISFDSSRKLIEPSVYVDFGSSTTFANVGRSKHWPVEVVKPRWKVGVERPRVVDWAVSIAILVSVGVNECEGITNTPAGGLATWICA